MTTAARPRRWRRHWASTATSATGSGQANALTVLGDVRRLTGDYRGAAEALEEALGIYRGVGDRLGQANALTVLGIVRLLTGDYRGAAEALEEALGIYRDLGDRLGQANALTALGVVRQRTGDYRGCGPGAGGGAGHLPRHSATGSARPTPSTALESYGG